MKWIIAVAASAILAGTLWHYAEGNPDRDMLFALPVMVAFYALLTHDDYDSDDSGHGGCA